MTRVAQPEATTQGLVDDDEADPSVHSVEWHSGFEVRFATSRYTQQHTCMHTMPGCFSAGAALHPTRGGVQHPFHRQGGAHPAARGP